MARTIITTVGISLLSNAQREGLTEDGEILDFLRRKPAEASAEINSLEGLPLRPGEDEVRLLVSNTPEGQRVAQLLEGYLKERGVSCSHKTIEGLGYEARGFVDYGLKSFVHALAQEVSVARKRGREVLINATGGFKAEIAYATVVGLVFKVPVYYMHERFKEIVYLPPTPLNWDDALIAWHWDFFQWLMEGEGETRPKAEVESRLKALPTEVGMLLEESKLDSGVVVGFSPLGQAYIEAFRLKREEVQQIPILLSPKAYREWSDMDPSSREKFKRVLENLRLPNRRLNSELKSGGGDALAYPTGHVDERVFYAERDGKLYVFALTRHGPEYDRLCKEGFRWEDHEPETFVPWEG
ncbi:putative CRISPR-associated protein [Thermus caliditerrae]|uniref:putative CRISPR-associated protein n=1 Tax=Thermus caliditerrae TaxID=1330700 RepID=UPI001F27728F|nr:putative CRISPR-associated protein [Thermus caliditerrae]